MVKGGKGNVKLPSINNKSMKSDLYDASGQLQVFSHNNSKIDSGYD